MPNREQLIVKSVGKVMGGLDPAIFANTQPAVDAIPAICQALIDFAVPGDSIRAGCAAYLFWKCTGGNPTVQDMLSIMTHENMGDARLGQVDAVGVICDLIASPRKGKRGILVRAAPETADCPDGDKKAFLNHKLSLNFSIVKKIEMP